MRGSRGIGGVLDGLRSYRFVRRFKRESAEGFCKEGNGGTVPTWPDVSSTDTDARQCRSVLRIDGKVDDSRHRVDEEQAFKQVGYGVGRLCAAR